MSPVFAEGSASNFVEALQQLARTRPGATAFIDLASGDADPGDSPGIIVTYEELDRRSRAIASTLQASGLCGQRAILLYPPGIEFISALFGCLYAGVVAVPSSLPKPRQRHDRTGSIARDCQPAAILTVAELKPSLVSHGEHDEALRKLPMIATDEVDRDAAHRWQSVACHPSSLACLQYTSGSTSEPKGVMLSHGNLFANAASIAAAFGHNSQTIGVNWLPHYHDMGLMAGVLQPIFAGRPSVQLSPIHVVQNPLRWLRAIDRFRGTVGGGPNFIYESCANLISAEQLRTLDLSSWEVAFNGAEPIHEATLERFAATFAPCGFRREALLPCYGLAEAVLMVSGGPKGSGAVVRALQSTANSSAATAPRNVGSGNIVTDVTVQIVDPETFQVCPPETVGEIWVKGPNVAQGYWDQPELSAVTFAASLGDGQHYLRTGDLGFMTDNQLHVTGRIKDLIIVDGRNHYPQDIEQTAKNCHVSLQRYASAAFAVEVAKVERLVLVHEWRSQSKTDDAASVIRALREKLAATHEITVEAVVLVKPGQIPRTSSGKIQRFLCRERLLAGQLNSVAQWRSNALSDVWPANGATVDDSVSVGSQADLPTSETRSQQALKAWLVAELAKRKGCAPHEIDVRREFFEYGLKSRDGLELIGQLEGYLGRTLSPTLIYDFPSIELVSRALVDGQRIDQPAPVSAMNGHAGTAMPYEPIAIVGMACRLPSADNPDALWKLLLEGGDAVREVPRGRWCRGVARTAVGPTGDKIRVDLGGFLDDVAEFDADFFRIPRREAALMDPQQRLLMELSWEALEDAGQDVERLHGTLSGVFIGLSTHDYGHRFSGAANIAAPYWTTGNASSIAANRLSYFFDWIGPSLVVDTACSSSLVSTWLACRSLQAGECHLAMAGGVNLILSPDITVAFARAGGISPSGRCHAFDTRADGIVRSEGAGVVVLKRLSDALSAGDRIYAVIRGGAVNQDGRSNGITAPNQSSQEDVLRRAYRNAGVDPRAVRYVETHGAGTLLGDVIEVGALGAVLGGSRSDGSRVTLGSLKTNIGHCEAAAGISSLIKVALTLHHGRLPRNLNFEQANPHIPFASLPFDLPQKTEDWPSGPRFAGISSFGFGGTNAHLVLEAAPPIVPVSENASEDQPVFTVKAGAHLLALSAASSAALKDLVERVRRKLVDRPDCPADELVDLCHAAGVRRSHLTHRVAFSVRDPQELIAHLEGFRAQQPDRMTSVGAVKGYAQNRIAFVFSGHGGQWHGMGRALLAYCPPFRAAVDACDRALRLLCPWSVAERWSHSGVESVAATQNLEWEQVSLCVFQIGLAEAWKALGVAPDAVVGHSMGEVAAACVAGALTVDDAMRVIVLRSRLLQQALETAPEGSGMAAVRLSSSEAEEYLRAYDGRLTVAVNNSPTYTVISGANTLLQELLQTLKKKRVGGRLMNVPGAAHTPELEPTRHQLEQLLGGLQPRATGTAFYSTVTGEREEGTTLTAAYWGRNVRQTVQFAPTVQRLAESGHRFYVEIGPHPLLTTAVTQCLAEAPWEPVIVPSMLQGDHEPAALLSAAGTLYSQGRTVDFRRITPFARRAIALPGVAWQRERCWVDEDVATDRDSGGHPFLGSSISLATTPGLRCWMGRFAPGAWEFIRDHRLEGRMVMPLSGILDMALSSALALTGTTEKVVAIEELSLESPMVCLSENGHHVQAVAARDERGDDWKLFSRPADTAEDAWQLHARARLYSAVPDETLERSLHDACARCGDVVDIAAIRRNLIHRSPASSLLQHVSELRRGVGCALGKVAISTASLSGHERFAMHPAWLDAILQILLAALDDKLLADADAVYLPSAVQRLQLFRQPAEEATLWSEATVHSNTSQDASVIAGDFFVWDSTGAPLMAINGFELRRISASRSAGSVSPMSSVTPLYQLAWQEDVHSTRRSSDSVTQLAKGKWLILADKSGYATELAAQLQHLGGVVDVLDDPAALLLPSCTASTPNEAHTSEVNGSHETEDRAAASIRGIIQLSALDLHANEPGASDFAAADEQLGTGLLRLVTTLVKARLRPAPRLWLVTGHAQQVAGDTSPPHLLQAPFWGAGRVLQREHPDWECTLVDVGAENLQTDCADLVQELLRADSEDQIALRNGRRLVARLIPAVHTPALPADDAPPHQLSSDATYIIGGGSGGLGLTLAKWMLDRGARHIALISRSGLTPSLQDQLKPWQADGRQILACAGDLTDRASIDRVLNELRRDLPPIRGVIHAASVLDDALLAQMSPTQMLSVVRPKTIGAWNLHDATQSDPLDFFVSFSSAASFLGPPGGANYAAGNAFLDALAHYRRWRGQPALTINWGPWQQVGIAAKSDYEQRISLRGFESLTPAEGVRWFEALLDFPAANVAVMPVDWQEVRRLYPATTQTPLLADLVSQFGAAGGGLFSGSTIRAELAELNAEDQRTRLMTYLRDLVAATLGNNPEQIDLHERLTDFGIDSLMAIELKNRLESDLKIAIRLVDFLDGPTIATMSGRVLEQLHAADATSASDSSDGSPNQVSESPLVGDRMVTAEIAEELLQEIDTLPEEELDRLLKSIAGPEMREPS